MSHLAKFSVRIRPEYQGRSMRPEVEQLNGRTYTFRRGWEMGPDDPYPGETAWIPADPAWPDGDGVPIWIASGDLVVAGVDTGDHVLHRPSGETWVVAYVRGDWLCACGWPESLAELADCELVKKATPTERLRLLQEMAAIRENDSRARHARWVLAQDESDGGETD